MLTLLVILVLLPYVPVINLQLIVFLICSVDLLMYSLVLILFPLGLTLQDSFFVEHNDFLLHLFREFNVLGVY